MKKKLPLYFLLIIMVLGTMRKGISIDADFGWQVKSGQWMVENGKILDEDIFSWVDSSKTSTWYNQEWLAEIIMYICSASAGTYFLLGAILSIIINTLCYIIAMENKKCSNILAFIIFFLLTIVSYIFMVVRPYMFGLIMFLLEVLIFERLRKRPESKVIFCLIPIGLIWINTHGGSANLLYIIAMIYIFTGVFNFDFGRIAGRKIRKKYLIKYGVVTLVSTAVMLINPYGIKMLYYPYVNMMDSQMTSSIVEWHSPVINNFPDIIAYIIIALLLGVMFIQEYKKVDFKDLCLAGFVIVMTLISWRHIMFLWAVAFLIIFKYVTKKKDTFPSKNIFIYSSVFIFTFICVLNYNDKIFYKEYISHEMVSSINEYKPKRIFNEYNVGGYLILQNIPVFIDGRYELYRDMIFKDFVSIKEMNEGAEKLIEEYKFDSFLVYEGTDLERYLRSNSKYRIRCKDTNEDMCLYILSNWETS